MKKETQQLVLMLVIGVAIGAIGAKLYLDKKAGFLEVEQLLPVTNESTTTESTVAAKEQTTKPVSNGTLPGVASVPANTRDGLSVNDQPAGGSAVVSGLNVTSPLWVAVYDNRNGVPGWILGAKRFLPGDKTGVVALLRNTVAGDTYYAVIHGDDGNLEFDKTKDVAPSPDQAIIVSFKAK